MCLSVWVLDGHPLYALLLASNRDELLARPTDPAHFWRDDPRVLAGRDLVCGGTWLGASRGGKVAFLSNCWAVDGRQHPISRGALITDFLQGSEGPQEYLQLVAQRAHLFNGFNLVAADVAGGRCSSSSDTAESEERESGGGAAGVSVRMYYLTNAPHHHKGSTSSEGGSGGVGQGEAASSVVQVEPGLHGLSNAALDTPWSKVERAKAHLAEVLAESGGGKVDAEVIIERVLMDAWQPAGPHTSDDADEAEHCPLGSDYDQRLTPVFVDCDTPKGAYGTRSCIVVAVHRTGLVEFTENSRSGDAPTQWTLRRFRFHIGEGSHGAQYGVNGTSTCVDGTSNMQECAQSKAG